MPTSTHYHPDAVAIVTDARYWPQGLIFDAWLRLKEEQGRPVTRDRLPRISPIRATGTFTPAAVIDFVTARTLDRTRAAIRARGLTPTGDDAA